MSFILIGSVRNLRFRLLSQEKNIWLQPDGINYRAEVWVNGNLLSTINGMFVNDYINITDFVKVGNKNVLAVKVYPVDVSGDYYAKVLGSCR